MILKHWNNLFNTDCEAIKIDPYGIIVYPIFKNGMSAIEDYTEKNKKCETFKNEQLKKLNHIIVYLRNPLKRFISGIHTYIEGEKLNQQEETILKQINEMTLCNRHFAPQYVWLMHLSKYFKGSVRFDPISELYLTIGDFGPQPLVPTITKERKQKILKINFKNYTNVDELIIEKYICRTIKLETVIKEFYNVLP